MLDAVRAETVFEQLYSSAGPQSICSFGYSGSRLFVESRSFWFLALDDDICQRLSLIAVGMEELRESLAAGQNSQSALASELHRKAHEVAIDVQSLSRNLHSSKLQYLGLHFTLSQFCERISMQYHIPITLRSGELPGNLPSDLELCIYRVAQEAVSNAVKHSHAPEVFVDLTAGDDTIILKVTDLGVGFDSSASSQGIGLITMRERLRMFEGELFVESIEGKGTTIIAKAKLQKAKGMGH